MLIWYLRATNEKRQLTQFVQTVKDVGEGCLVVVEAIEVKFSTH